ncbi:aldose epimerase family protein [Chitinophaga alhagiae]|uniref:aldose epimerase family protein n=1 Tax=Chitinophaga alhagiae TaxID=2203219 RepID=UPI001E4678B1|nr:aldose epimerase family protein [Chitinophaga alhagiae]
MTIVTCSLLAGSACNNAGPKKSVAEDSTAAVPAIEVQPYGEVDGEPVSQYTLANGKGMIVKVINYGGIITDIITPDKDGNAGNVVLSYDSLAGYRQKGNPYFGTLVGRYANRIAKARFNIDAAEYKLAANNNGNSLHGGLKGFDKAIWKATPLPGDSSLLLEHTSPDGEEGYPGTLQAQVIYTLTANNGLKIEYVATTDKPTPVNLTNHTYFNLSAGKDSTILNHVLQLDAPSYTPVDAQLIPTGKIEPVKGTPMDFTTAKRVGDDIGNVKGGYDHNWVFEKEGLQTVGSLYDPGSGRFMTLATSEPGVQFYTGNFLDGSLKFTRNGAYYGKNAGLCLETQRFPDSPNQPSFPNTILKPGARYTQTTIYQFSIK